MKAIGTNRSTKRFKGALSLTLSLALTLGGVLFPYGEAQARLIFTTESDGVNADAYHLDNDDSSAQYIDLAFGTGLGATLRYDKLASKFFFNHAVNLMGNELQNFLVENIATASAPTCDGSSKGRLYYDTDTNKLLFCNGTAWTDSADLDEGSVTTTEILNGTILTEDLSDGAVTSAKIFDNTIVHEDINTGAVRSDEILDDTILHDDINTGAVRSDEILDNTITFNDIAARTVTTTFTPEYPNFTLNADGSNNIGTLEADLDGTTTPARNYYKWSTMNDTTAQDYDIVMQWAIPENFQGFADAGNLIELDIKTKTTTTTDNKLDVTFFDTDGTEVVLTGGATLASGTADTWEAKGMTFAGGTFTPGQYVTLKIKMTSLDQNGAYVGALKFRHKVK